MPEGRAPETSSRPHRRALRRLLRTAAAVLAALYGATLIAAYTPLTERTIHTEIVINAPAATVWQVLTALDSYAAWNPFFQRASGTVAVGERLRLERRRNTGTMVFTPTVLEVRENRELRWLGHVLLPGIFSGEHSFTLIPLPDNRVQVVQRESFRGVLVPFFASLLNETEVGFVDLNRALKARAEAHENP